MQGPGDQLPSRGYVPHDAKSGVVHPNVKGYSKLAPESTGKQGREFLAADATADPGRAAGGTGDAAPARQATIGRRHLGRPRLLIIGCGDIGVRIVSRLGDRYRIVGAVHSLEGMARVRAAGGTPLRVDLDRLPSLARLAGLAERVLVLAPASPSGERDGRSRRILAVLHRTARARLVYVSTTGVYGDRRGAWTDETTPPRPGNDRARRRLDAERRLRTSPWHACVLRVPGIYGPRRLPIERLRQGLAVPLPEQDVMTNHVHSEDLARICIAAVHRGAPARCYNAVDQSALALGQYLDRVADFAGLPRPPRLPWEQLQASVGPQRMSFLEESRRLRNQRLKRELRVRLRFPDVDAGLAAMRAAAPQASNSPSTDR